MRPKLSIVLSMYNEEKAIQLVVEELTKILEKNKISHQIILVEGGSSDNSFKIARRLEKKYPQCIAVKYGHLLGEKIIKGLKEARGKYVGIMYSDGQVNPYVIPSFIKMLDEKKSDIIKGSRRARKGLSRRITSFFFNLISRLLFSIKTWDINGHPKIFDSRLISLLNLQVKDVTIDLEIMVKAKKLNLKVKEILVDERDRIGGSSSVYFITALRTLMHVLSFKWGKKKKLFEVENIK
ncbi:MAG: Glycosyl transferase family 2 [Candidatus Roizmanbacteria bacterium GW2011_GWC2_37_13]|uniref:Glycosyl transferase family 2 n=1 Tax=Candidatus Roizmanbacteria bacterium GW2011_GWC2_37_13 TaxID=1618486 RepID=A0A0G0G9P8_9BACT|nr:MAG: Glycosyl transferase family 2 [Candidatus Roizmanbacteria bacterium GW2011_GWC1_37_12]KKQ26697.1 MAG: Glycosyl transferase family 2 [Candidatus Roizmanbacteria bacterium GW2011_GWC2_37_13]